MMQAVVFDMDGLMFNTEDVYTSVGEELLRRRGHVFTAELKDRMMGLQARPSFEAMIDYCGLGETWQQLAAESNRLFLEMLESRLKPMPGLMALLDALERAGIPKAIGTSSCRELVYPCLKPFGLATRFRFILTAEDVTHGKPDPEIYRKAAERMGAPASEMAVLEDSQNGCIAAAAAGAFAIAVPGDHSRGHDFSQARLVADGLDDPRLYAALGIAGA